MNNCPKCGNPLQPGTSSCPICGTEIEGVSSATTQMTVASVAKPTTTVAPTIQVATPQATQQQPAPQPIAVVQGQQGVPVQTQNVAVSQTPIAPQLSNNEVQVVTPQVVSVDEATPVASNVSAEPVAQPAPAVVTTPVVVQTDNGDASASQQEVIVPAQAPVDVQQPPVVAPQVETTPTVQAPQVQPTPGSVQAPVPVVTEPVVQSQPVATNVAPAPVATQAPTSSVEQVATPNETQSVSQPSGIVNTQPEFSQPAPVAISPQDANSSQSVVQDTKTSAVTDDKKVKKEKGPKKPLNKNVIIIAVFVLAVAGIGIFMLTKSSKKGPVNPSTAPVALKGDTVTSNGYKFTLAEGWIITEGNGNVIVSNPINSESKKEAATVQLRLTHADSNIEEITEDVLKKYVENNDKLVDAEIVKKEISSKDAYLINAKVNDLPVQIYFIGGGTRLLLGVTVVYDNNEAKDNNEKVVLQMVETLSYSDDSIKALDVVGMYKDVFDIYGNVIDYYKYSYGNDIANENSGETENNPENPQQGEQQTEQSQQNPEVNPPVATETEPQATEVQQGETPTN